MKTVQVNASKEYSVVIGSDILTSIGTYVSNIKNVQTAVIVSDDNVWPLYGKIVTECLQKVGINPLSYIFPAGEDSKNGNTYFGILNFLAENCITRSDVLIALGGGVVGDMTGFAAATYLRGISYIQVPTSLLAMVDSSVGGKTAIDLPSGKNLVGAFYQPNLVLCDISTLDTLPEKVFRDGCAEVIKYAILYDSYLFKHLQSNGMSFDKESVISRCVALKRDVVTADEFDKGERQKLNLGHTIGHSIEMLSNFSITHGEAVAIGIKIIAKSALSAGYCSASTLEDIQNILDKFNLPSKTDFTAGQLCSVALSDKKRNGNTINLIVPKAIGNCILKPTNIYELLSFIKAGL